MSRLTLHCDNESSPTNAAADSLAAAVEPLLIDRRELARLLGIGVATLDRLRAAGKIGPREIRLGANVRYQLGEVREWLAVGAPDRAEWMARQAAQGSG